MEARLAVPSAELATLTEPWRHVLLPSGGVSANLQWAGGQLAGWLEVSNAATRPLPGLGTIREAALRLELDSDRVRVTRGTATLNGQPVTLSGQFAAPGLGEDTLDLHLHATNLALARSSELVLRADVHLSLQRTNATTPPRIGGEIRLRDSLVLMDFRDAVAVDLERPRRRPPFFSVETDPFADWTLDLKVQGSRFGRIISPAVQGTLSANARLLGTLRNPRLLGDVAAEDGALVFPFGRLTLNSARVRFTETDPFSPNLEGRAEGLNFGYNLALDFHGTLSRPELVFSSLPPLTTSEILQMLTAGTLPRGEYAFSEGGKVQRVGTYLARDLLSSLTGNKSTEPRLTLRSGQHVSTAGRLTYGVEYRLSDRWYLVGEYDRWNQLNGGVRLRLIEK